MVIEFLPFSEIVIQEKGISSDDVLACITHCAAEQDGLIFADGSDGVAEAGRWAVSRKLCFLHTRFDYYSNPNYNSNSHRLPTSHICHLMEVTILYHRCLKKHFRWLF